MVDNKDVRVGVIKPVTDSDIVCSIESLPQITGGGAGGMSLQNWTMTLGKLHYRTTQLTLEITNPFVNMQEGFHFTSTKK